MAMDAVTKVRHETLRSEPVHTSFGIVELDEKGYVTNAGSLSGTLEELVRDIPGFLDASVFAEGKQPDTEEGAGETTETVETTESLSDDEKVTLAITSNNLTREQWDALSDEERNSYLSQLDGEETEEGAGETTETVDETKDNTPKDATNDEIWTIIQTLSEDKANLNTAGYVDLDALNKALADAGFNPTTGKARKELTDERRAS